MSHNRASFDPFAIDKRDQEQLEASALPASNISGNMCIVRRLLGLVWAIALIESSLCNAAALVGETRTIQVEPATTQTLAQVNAEYRQPASIPFPPSNPYTIEKAFLGQQLFFDTRLSGGGTLSCASCHNPSFSFSDGRRTSLGHNATALDRKSPSIINSAWGSHFMWDGSFASLEEQVAGPLANSAEMNQPLETLIQTLSAIGAYRSAFAVAFPHQPITSDTLAAAIATYERTIVSAIAPFDRWIDGDELAVPESAKRGFALFNTKARCALCHGGWLFTDDGFHDVGLSDDDLGRGRLLPQVRVLQHAFKTPSLREVAGRGPYMHDGSLPTLDAVVAHYNQGGVNRFSRSELVTPLGLAPAEQADIVAFLQTLTSLVRLDSPPVLPR